MSEQQQEMVSITVLIAGRPYPLKINVEDEANIRKIVKEVNDKINRFQLTYTTKDKQDCLAMVLLTYAVDLHKAENKSPSDENITSSSSGIMEKLSILDDSLDALLDFR